MWICKKILNKIKIKWIYPSRNLLFSKDLVNYFTSSVMHFIIITVPHVVHLRYNNFLLVPCSDTWPRGLAIFFFFLQNSICIYGNEPGWLLRGGKLSLDEEIKVRFFISISPGSEQNEWCTAGSQSVLLSLRCLWMDFSRIQFRLWLPRRGSLD